MGSRAMAAPWRRTSPPCSVARPMIVARSVVLPAPLRPRMARDLPADRRKLKSSSTTVSPWPAVTARSSTAAAGGLTGVLPQIDGAHLRIGRDVLRRALAQDGA